MEVFQDKNDWVENACIMNWRVRPGGRPKTTWREVVETDCKTKQLNKEDAIQQSPQSFFGPFSGTTQVSRCHKRTLDFIVQGKIKRGRQTDHPARRHSIRTNQCPPPPSSPYFLQARCPSCRPANSVKARKALRML